MGLRILIPSDDPEGVTVAAHFGRAPYFAVIELDDSGLVLDKSIHPNTGEHSGGRGHAHSNVLSLKPSVVIVQGMGPRGLSSFQSQDIAVLKANRVLVDSLIVAYVKGDLTELTEGCSHAHHK